VHLRQSLRILCTNLPYAGSNTTCTSRHATNHAHRATSTLRVQGNSKCHYLQCEFSNLLSRQQNNCFRTDKIPPFCVFCCTPLLFFLKPCKSGQMEPVRQPPMNMSTETQSFGDTCTLCGSDCCCLGNQLLRGHIASPHDSTLQNEAMFNGWIAATQPLVYSQLPQSPDLLSTYSMPLSLSNMPLLEVPGRNEIVNSNLYGTTRCRHPTFVSLIPAVPSLSPNFTPLAGFRYQQIDAAQFLSGAGNVTSSPVIHGVQPPIVLSKDKESVESAAANRTDAGSTTSIVSLTLDADSTYSMDPPTPYKGKPKRALTAYNLFFKEQRELILAERRQSNNALDKSMLSRLAKRRQNGVGFEEMGKMIGQRWKELGNEMRLLYEAKAKEEKRRYSDELAAYMEKERNEREIKLACLQATVTEEAKCLYFSREKKHWYVWTSILVKLSRTASSLLDALCPSPRIYFNLYSHKSLDWNIYSAHVLIIIIITQRLVVVCMMGLTKRSYTTMNVTSTIFECLQLNRTVSSTHDISKSYSKLLSTN